MSTEEISLDGTWHVQARPRGDSEFPPATSAGTDSASLISLEATVPGSLQLDLLITGALADPNIGAQARESRWTEKFAWWYSLEFTVEEAFLSHTRQYVVFDGLDLNARIFLNGSLLGTSSNSFGRTELEVAQLITAGANRLDVELTSGMESLKPLVENDAVRNQRQQVAPDPLHANRSFILDAYRHLRKPAYSTYGWDWCDPLPRIGITGSVSLVGESGLVLRDVRIDTLSVDPACIVGVELTIDQLAAWREAPAVVRATLTNEHGESTVVIHTITAGPGLSHHSLRITVPDARLWWPNGMGDQPLYRATVELETDDGSIESYSRRIGLRTVQLDRGDGSRFCVKVNGQDVFCRGGNLAPLDLIPARVTRERYFDVVRQAADAHFTMLRVNGVGLYESDHFYDACDESGILVWQDFTFACAIYPARDDAFLASVRNEVDANVRRLRSHPSLALWCGSNEGTLFWGHERFDDGTDHGAHLFTRVISEMCRDLDPLRPYWIASPFGGELPTDELSGDLHGWQPWPHPSEWNVRLGQLRGRFYSEYFAPHSAPHLDTVIEYMGTTDPDRESEMWRIHTNSFINAEGGVLSPEVSIEAAYGTAGALSLPDYVLYSQLAQATAIAQSIEAMRFRKLDPVDDCEGALMWSFNDTWGETGWSVLDGHGRRKAGYYALRRTCAPVATMVREVEGMLVTRVVNDTLEPQEVVLHLGWMRLDGTLSEREETRVSVAANSIHTVASVPAHQRGRTAARWLYASTVQGPIAASQSVWLPGAQKELEHAEASIVAEWHEDHVVLTSSTYQHAVHLADTGLDGMSDNYFDLLPGVPRRVDIVRWDPDLEFTAVLPLVPIEVPDAQ